MDDKIIKVNNDEGKGVYLAEDIARMLNLGRSKTYVYLEEVYQKQQPFKVIKIGKLVRVPRASFDNWISTL